MQHLLPQARRRWALCPLRPAGGRGRAPGAMISSGHVLEGAARARSSSAPPLTTASPSSSASYAGLWKVPPCGQPQPYPTSRPSQGVYGPDHRAGTALRPAPTYHSPDGRMKKLLTATPASRYNPLASQPARPEVVPSLWQQSGPILVASDTLPQPRDNPAASR